MRCYGGTVETTFHAPPKGSVLAATIENSITLVRRESQEPITLHRDGKTLPARFFKTGAKTPGSPELSINESDEYQMPFAVYTILGDTITKDTLVILESDDGRTEQVLVEDFTVHPPGQNMCAWKRDRARGFKKRRYRRPRIQHA